MADNTKYVACAIIAGAYDEEKDTQVEFQPGEYVEGLTGDEMRYLWEQGAIAPEDSDRARAVRIEAGLDDPGERVPKFGEFFSTESAPVDPVIGRQAGTSHPDFPFSSVDSKEVTPAQSAARAARSTDTARAEGTAKSSPANTPKK